MTRWFSVPIILLLFINQLLHSFGWSEYKSTTEQNLTLFQSIGVLTGIPWEYLAAMNQFEENITKNEKRNLISIKVPTHLWSGPTNPNPHDNNPQTITFFQGIGKDVNGDKKANSEDPADVLYSVAHYLGKSGTNETAIRSQLWNYYQNTVTVETITHIAKIFKSFQSVNLYERTFPIPLKYNYSYESTWGDPREFGGKRIHEGTDIYANYGTPVLSTCYGYIELIGWNKYGGWRVGIRDIRNHYHYFAHLNHFKKKLKKGDIVKPGDVIGSVGSSGYGPPGTSGKFPPHLHFGMYSFNGSKTYSFDPYPQLKKWERDEKKKKK